MTIASLPLNLWHLYVDNLVNYKHNSWVDSIASTCRVLAFAMILPFILLTLLDVASYVIARTLGVIDETKASTSGELDTSKSAGEAAAAAAQPAIVMDRDGDGDSARAATMPLPPESPADDGNLKLAGVDTFSPAPSQPGSPTVQRREFMQHAGHYGFGSGSGSGAGAGSGFGFGYGFGTGLDGWGDSGTSLHALQQHERAGAGGRGVDRHGGRAEEDEGGKRGDGGGNDEGGSGATTPREPASHGSGDSSSGESSSSSYAIVDRDSGSEDAGVVLRRRTRQQPGTGPDADDGAA